MTRTEFVLGELFCGPGGMALGAKLANTQISNDGESFSIRHAWGVDRDPIAIETYNSNELGVGVVSDAIKFSQSLNESKGVNICDFEQISALAFGFPCNDFSLVGKQRGAAGKYGDLYKAGVFAIEHSNPKWFVAENVSGIRSANSGDTFRKILVALEGCGEYGYDLTVNLYRFEDYGVPQYRHRYIIVGVRKDLNIKYRVPAPTHLDRHVTAAESIGKRFSAQVENNELTRQSRIVEGRLLLTPPGKNAWFLDWLSELEPHQIRKALQDVPWYDQALRSITDPELKEMVLLNKLHCTKAKMSHIYRRLEADRPSYTLTGSGGGGTHVYHWEECRALTNRERARLQSFPDGFVFRGQKEQVRKQIGMAVPPAGAKIIFESILKTFADIPYQSVTPTLTEW